MHHEHLIRQTIRLYLQQMDVQAVAGLMNEQGMSYQEVAHIIRSYKRRQRLRYLVGFLAFTLTGCIGFWIEFEILKQMDRFYWPLVGASLGLLGGGIGCLYRVARPR